MSKPINQGQQFLNAVEAALDHNGERPLGMPPFSEIETELKRLGYGKTDAESVYDYWLSNGFRMGPRQVRDWRAAIRNMIRYNRLPSQQVKPPGLIEHEKTKPAQLAEAERDRRRKLGRQATDEELRNVGHALRQWRKNQ